MPFKPGQITNPKGGKKGNKGGGRPPSWLAAKCSNLIEKKKLIEFLAAVAAGEPFVEKVVVIDGDGKSFERVRESADVKDRLKAVEMLMDRGWGRPAQVVTDQVGGAPRMVLIVQDEKGEVRAA